MWPSYHQSSPNVLELDPGRKAWQRTIMTSEAGRRRRSAGKAAEDALQIVHVAAMNRSAAWIRKVPTAYKVIQSLGNGRLVVVPEEKVGVDYVGVLPGGRALYVECKKCSDDIFPVSNVAPNQRQELDEASRLGASCWVVIVWDPKSEQVRARLAKKNVRQPALVAIPWDIVRQFGTSIPRDVLVEHASGWDFYAKG